MKAKNIVYSFVFMKVIKIIDLKSNRLDCYKQPTDRLHKEQFIHNQHHWHKNKTLGTRTNMFFETLTAGGEAKALPHLGPNLPQFVTHG